MYACSARWVAPLSRIDPCLFARQEPAAFGRLLRHAESGHKQTVTNPIEYCQAMTSAEKNRSLTHSEYVLARWMLENGLPEAQAFLEQLERAEVMSWRCPCGCASINFQIQGHPPAPPGVHIIGDFLCGPIDAPAGAFIFESEGLLGGIEVYSMASDAPSVLPVPPLRPFG